MWGAPLLLLGVQVVLVCLMFGKASASAEQVPRKLSRRLGMTPIGRDTCHVVIVAWVCRRRGDTRLRGRRKCRMARYQLRELTEKRLSATEAWSLEWKRHGSPLI